MSRKLTVVQTPDGRPCLVSAKQKMMLDFIAAHPGAMYEEVGDHIEFDRPSVTAYASRMEKVGLLVRERVRIGSHTYAALTLKPGVVLDFDVLYV